MLTFEDARKLYEGHVMNRRPRLKRLMRYYEGNHAILNRKNRKGKKTQRWFMDFLAISLPLPLATQDQSTIQSSKTMNH